MRSMKRCLLLIAVMVLVCSCYPSSKEQPGNIGNQPAHSLPEWTDQLQLTAVPKPQTATCSADGKLLLIDSDQGLLLVRNTAGHLQEASLIPNDPPVLASALSADGAWLAIATADSLQLYATADNSLQSSVRWLQPVQSVSLQISRDGLSVAVVRNGYLHLYHGPYLNLRWSCQLPEGNIEPSMLMSANGLTLAAYAGGELLVFAPDAATPLWKRPLPGSCREITLSADGVYIAAEFQTDAEHGRLLLFERWSADPTWEFEHQGSATCLRFSPDGTWLALASDHFYLFRGEQAQPVMQLNQSGSAALTNGQLLLITGQQLYLFQTSGQDAVTYQLPVQLSGDLRYIYSEQEWLFAINNQGTVFLVRLPLEPAGTGI